MSQIPEEHALIERAIRGDRYSFRMLVEAHKTVAHNMALRLLRQEEDAEEIVQDAFLKAYHALPSFRREASFKTWILKIVHHLCLNRLRDRQRAGQKSPLPFSGQAPEGSSDL